ncbi:hypothetical protein JFV29_23945 [Peribacillus sp. TH16]|uniref:DUF6270 domain-containing protein n=1 Tax=Peribacillus sp. TH16 TaxID=2798482 RepID=UPI00191411E7|nr:DUF6270 domain-containing protein [Peribacillus sp. TH16]MBK5484894.1 hypothetical protein [Peribacillus sp. TH16]
MFQVENIDVVDKFIKISFSAKEKFENLKLELRIRDSERFLLYAYEEQMEIDVINNHELYEVKINITDMITFFKIINPKRQIIFLNIKDENENYYDLFTNEKIKKHLKELGNKSLNKLANLSFIGRGKGELAFVINKRMIKNVIDYLSIDNHNRQIILAVSSKIQNIEEPVIVENVLVKKRVFKDTLIYTQSLPLEKLSNNLFSLDYNQLNLFTYDENVNVIDFIVEVQENGITLESDVKKIDDYQLSEIKVNDNEKFKPYWTVSNGLSIRVEKVYQSILVDSVALNDNSLRVCIKDELLSNLDDIKCIIFRENKISNDLDLIPYKEIQINGENDYSVISVNLSEIFEDIETNQIQKYQVLITDKTRIYKLLYNPRIKSNLLTQNVRITFDSDKGFNIIINPINEQPIKLGVIGSCFTRLAFSSKDDYYNPDYKLFFNVDFSHFWPSLISLCSDPIEFNKNQFPEVKEKELINIRREYEKITFKELKEAKVEYILVDFFVDAIHGTRRFQDGTFIVQNGTIHQTAYLKNKILRETEQFDYRNPLFWEKWKKSCDQFIVELEKITELNKVILVWGGLAKDYYDKNKEIKSFIKEKKYTNTQLNYYNNIWDKMNNYFLSKAPNVKVIDLRKYNFLSSVDHKDTFGPHHFEGNYYKSLIGELAKIVTKANIIQ